MAAGHALLRRPHGNTTVSSAGSLAAPSAFTGAPSSQPRTGHFTWARPSDPSAGEPVTSYTVYVDGVPLGSTTGPSVLAMDLNDANGLTSGPHTATVRTNTAGRQSGDSGSVTFSIAAIVSQHVSFIVSAGSAVGGGGGGGGTPTSVLPQTIPFTIQA